MTTSATTLLNLLLAFLTSFSSTVSQSPSDAGQWRLLRPSIGISAMHMQLLPGDKLLIFDRTDFGPSNLSLPPGRCRLDPSDLALTTDCTAHSLLLNIASLSLRPLTILSDTWCSSGSLLDNATLLQSGGFNDGDRNIRLFTNSPSSDWSELPSYLSVRRWYASNQLLPDGRVIILGGRRQFSYEFFPKDPSQALTFLPFLEETRDGDAENNLYPFLHVLPNGSLFVFANTRSLLLDLSPTASPPRYLPTIPDAIPRNYPSSGSSVLLPLRPPSHFPTILICGGAPRGAYQSALNGTFIQASRTCGKISPLDPDPTWEMEDMPLPRVMGDMVILPTGAVLVVNGAASGTAGWELARDPVTSPVLYDPNGPVGARFSLMSSSPIPRLYHSSAVLDTHARVIVGGSNPHVGYNFTNVEYPTQLSLEAFHPPYLDSRFESARPRVVTVWAGNGSKLGQEASVVVGHGEALVVRFTVEAYQADGKVEVALIAPAFATHAVGMNQRMVVLSGGRVEQVAPFTYEMEALSPPTPEVAPPGYYMMFVVHAGVPSRGAWAKIQRKGGT